MTELEKDEKDEFLDAIADILDICVGWTRPMSNRERLDHIQRIGHELFAKYAHGEYGCPSDCPECVVAKEAA